MAENYTDSLIFTKNLDEKGTPFTPKLIEVAVVSEGGRVQCKQNVYKKNGINIVSPDGLRRVNKAELLLDTTNAYFIYEDRGEVLFSSDLIGQAVAFEYYGNGNPNIGDCRVFTTIDNNGNITETLNDIIKEGREVLDVVKNIGDGVIILNSLETVIQNADTLNIALGSKNVTANKLIPEMDDRIGTGTQVRDSLSEHIQTGEVLNTALVGSIETANLSDEVLNSTILKGGEVDESLNQSIASGNSTKEVLEANINTGKVLDVSLKTSLTEGTALNSDLNTNITQGSEINTYLSGAITEASDKNEILSQTILNANAEAQILGTALETARMTLEDLNVQIEQIVETDNAIFQVESEEWVLNEETNRYEKMLNHGMRKSNLIFEFQCLRGNKRRSYFMDYEIQNDNEVKLITDSPDTVYVNITGRYFNGTKLDESQIEVDRLIDGTTKVLITREERTAFQNKQEKADDNLATDNKTVVGAINEVYNKALEAFQSASDGKQKLATAITGKGIETSPSDSFDTMVANINNLSSSNVTIDGIEAKGKVELVKSEFKDWVKKTNITLPYDFYKSSAVVLNNEIHILGSSVSGNYTKHYKWNGSEWVKVSTLPYSFYRGSAVVLNNEIHILGSYVSGAETGHYKWNGISWTKVSTLPYKFYDSCAVILNEEIHILGGGSGTSSLVKHYKFDGEAWTSVSTLPYSFYYGSAVVYNNEIHIFGGYNQTKHYKYNGATWNLVSTLPYSFYYGYATILDEEIHILGGYNSSGKTNHLKLNGEEWIPVGKVADNYYAGSSVTLNSEIYMLGGTTGYYKAFSVYGNLYKMA